jgi:hypothetical protein
MANVEPMAKNIDNAIVESFMVVVLSSHEKNDQFLVVAFVPAERIARQASLATPASGDGSIDRHEEPSSTGPAAQSDSMSKGDMSKDKMSRKMMAKSKSSTKLKKTDDKMSSIQRSQRPPLGDLFVWPAICRCAHALHHQVRNARPHYADKPGAAQQAFS